MYVYRLCDDFHTPENMKPDLSTHITPLTMELNSLGIRQKILSIHSETDNFGDIAIEIVRQKRPFSFLRAGLEAYRMIKASREKPDIIHFHNARFAAIMLKKRELPPLVMTIHDSPETVMKSINIRNPKNAKETLYFYCLTRLISKRLDALICVSPGVRTEVIERWGLDPSKVYTAKSGVDTTKFRPDGSKKTTDLLFVGRFVEKKRPLDFVRIVAKLKKKNPRIKALMIGSDKKDPLSGTIASEIESMNLKDNITIIGSIPQEKLRDYYNGSKIFILPSTSEGTSKALLESMACETPIISTKITGNKGICHDGKTGYLVEPKDIDAFADKAELILEDPNLMEKMGKNAREFVEKEYSWKATAKIHREIYEKIKKR